MTSTLLNLHTLSHATDEDLARQARRDPAAFGELYDRHFQRVYRYHLARTANPPDAQDLTAQAFLAALEGLAGYQGRGCFLAWLMGIARRKLALSYRQRKPQTPLDVVDDLPDPAPLPETTAGKTLQLSQISRALERIAPERAEAIMLCVIGDLTAFEAGQTLGKSEAAVKMLVLRGLRDLRVRLNPAGLEEV